MADDSGVPPLPRRIPGASGSPRPSAGVERAEIPEDLRQRVLAAIAIELEHDRAEQRRGGQSVPGGPGIGQVPAAAGEDGETLVGGRAPRFGLGPNGDAILLDSLAAPSDAPVAGGSGPTADDSTATLTDSAAPAEDAALAEDAVPAEDVAPAEDAALAEDAVPAEDVAPAEDAAPAGEAAPAESPAPPASAAMEDAAAAAGTTTPLGDANRADAATQEDGVGPRMGAAALADSPTQRDWFTPHRRPTPGDAAARDHGPEEAVPRPSVFQPRRAAGANGATQPPAQIRREHLPPALLRRPLDPEAHTEPLPKLPGFRVDPAAMARTQPAPPPASAAPSASTPPADAVAPAVSVPPEIGPPETGLPETAPPAAAAPVVASLGEALPRPRRQGRSYRVAGLILAVVALVAAGVLWLALSGRAATGGHTTGSAGAGAAVRNSAADWVAAQVSRTAVVACDPVTCHALRAHGVPTGSLYLLGPQATTPLRAQIIVATAAVRAQFGSRLGTVYAPAVLASFGAGPDRIDIRQTAPRGAAAYQAAARADLAHRIASGTELLHNSRITATALARRQLAAGQVDMRLLLTIAQLAAAHPIYIVDFGAPPPGAGPGVPLRHADLATGPHSHHHLGWLVNPGYVRSMVSFLHAQRGPFRPLRVQTVYLWDGGSVLRIEFAAPIPLGLLGPGA